MGRIRTFILPLAAGAAALLGAGHAQNISAVTAEELEAALSEAGFGDIAFYEEASGGGPVMYATAGDTEFWVRTLDCSGRPPACGTLMFFANFPLGRAPTAKDFRIVDDFRDGQVFGRAYILESENKVGVDYVIELEGGVAKEHLSQNIGRWADVIIAFIEKFNAGYDGS